MRFNKWKSWLFTALLTIWVFYVTFRSYCVSRRTLFIDLLNNRYTFERQKGTCRRCVDVNQYKEIITPLKLSQKKLDVVLLIMSSHSKDALKRRKVIRNTWANSSIYSPVKILRVFVLGKTHQKYFCM